MAVRQIERRGCPDGVKRSGYRSGETVSVRSPSKEKENLYNLEKCNMKSKIHERTSFVFIMSILTAFTLLQGCGGGGGGNGGGGRTGETNIGPSGGTAASENGRASATVPPGALSQETIITVSPASNPPAGAIGTAFQFGPAGTTFSQAVTISIAYDDTALNGVAETDLRLATAVNNQWQGTGNSKVETGTNVVSGETTHFSVFAIVPASLLPSGNITQLNAEGLNLIRNKNGPAARDKFKQAVDSAGAENSNEADTARFFYAVTRIGGLAFDLASDGNAADLNRPGDLLDRFGCTGNRDPLAWTVACPKVPPIPSTLPSVSDLKTFLQNVLLPEINGAISNLDGVSKTFNRRWVEPVSNITVESDYGDVLTYRAVLKSLQAHFLVLLSYHFEGDVKAEVEDKSATIQERLERNPDVLKPTPAASINLPLARTALQGVADDLTAAIDSIQAETDSQEDDLINLSGATAQQVVQEKSKFALYKRALSEQTTVRDNNNLNPNDDKIFNGDPFFSGNLDLRSLFPGVDPVDGNKILLFPDSTFGGTVLRPDYNEDEDPPNGTPDILE